MTDLRQRIADHLRTLPPHTASRKTTLLLAEAADELAAAFVAGANWFCEFDGGEELTTHERREAERQARRRYNTEANDASTK